MLGDERGRGSFGLLSLGKVLHEQGEHVGREREAGVGRLPLQLRVLVGGDADLDSGSHVYVYGATVAPSSRKRPRRHAMPAPVHSAHRRYGPQAATGALNSVG